MGRRYPALLRSSVPTGEHCRALLFNLTYELEEPADARLVRINLMCYYARRLYTLHCLAKVLLSLWPRVYLLTLPVVYFY